MAAHISNGIMVNNLLGFSAFYCAMKSAQNASHFVPSMSLKPRTMAYIAKLTCNEIGINGKTINIQGKTVQEIENLLNEFFRKIPPKEKSEKAPTSTYTVSISLIKKDFQINTKTVENITAFTKTLFYGLCAYGFTQAVR